LDWQLAITGVIVLAAVAYIARSIVRAMLGRKAGGCGLGCGKCEPPAAQETPGRIPLRQFPSR
jgi:hypothetical protein